MKKTKQLFVLISLCGISKFSNAQFSTGAGIITQTTSGNVGVGFPAYTPVSLLQVKNGSVLFDGITGAIPVTGAGTRMMWYPAKSAFRAGQVTGTQWDDASIGTQSAAFGYNNIASGSKSFATGTNNTASGLFSFATGTNTISSNTYSFATGGNTTASGQGSSTFGNYTIASGGYSSAFGQYSTASGSYSVAFGFTSVAQSFNSFVIGRYNVNPGNYTLGGWVATEPLFVIGNGTSAGATSNAMTVLKNGDVGIGISTPRQTLDVNGRIYLANGVIQTGGSTITTTSELGLYSLNSGSNVRFVTNNGPIKFFTDGGTNPIGGVQKMSIQEDGKVLIGDPVVVTMPTGYKLYVQTGILTEKVKVAVASSANWADYVFEKDYVLKNLNELETFIKTNKHLPNISSAQEVVKEGLDLGAMDAKLLEKIEELTLYIIEQNKRIEKLEQK